MNSTNTTTALGTYSATHFRWHVANRVGYVELSRPERKNPLTFDSYAELRDMFRALAYATDVRAVILRGAGGNFCSGGDVHEIIGPLTKMDTSGLLAFTRMTGDLVKAIRACPQPVIAMKESVGDFLIRSMHPNPSMPRPISWRRKLRAAPPSGT